MAVVPISLCYVLLSYGQGQLVECIWLESHVLKQVAIVWFHDATHLHTSAHYNWLHLVQGYIIFAGAPLCVSLQHDVHARCLIIIPS